MTEPVVLSSVVFVVTLGLLVVGRAVEAGRLAAEHVVYRLQFPRDLAAEAVTRFLAGLNGAIPSGLVGMEAVAFEVTAENDRITHRLVVPARLAEAVTAALRAHLPNVRFVVDEEHHPVRVSAARELRLCGRLLRTDQPEAASAAVLAALQPLGDEAAVVQWMVRPTPYNRLRQRPSLLALISGRMTDTTTRDRGTERHKSSEPLFVTVGRVGVRAPSPGRRGQLLRRLVGVLHVLTTPEAAVRVRAVPGALVARRLVQRSLPLVLWPAVVNAAELAALIGFPVGSPQLPGLVLGGCRLLPPSSLVPAHGRIVARSNYPGTERLLAVDPLDRLRHLWVLGPTGSGKSTLLCNLIRQDAEAGAGVVVVDPMGDLVANCLDRVPPDRVRDVIVLDPADDRYPVGLNVLADARHDPELVTDQVVGIFHRLYHAYWGPRSDDILRAAVATLVHQPETYTLCEVPRLLTDDAFRRRLVGTLDDPIGLEPFWTSFDNMSAGERTQAIGPVLNKLRAFTMRQRVRRVIGQVEGVDLDVALAEGKLVFVSLRKGLLGDETAALIGALFVARLWQAVQRRTGLPADRRRPVMGYLDEFQDYLALPTNVATMLVQARGLGLGLTLAHQNVGQLTPAVRSAVLANARSKAVFQTSADDAHTLARELAPHLGPHDLQGLGPFEVALTVAVGGQVAPPVTGVTLPLAPPTGRGQAARAWSRQTYGTDAAEVDAALRARHGDRPGTGPVGRQRRQP